MSRATIVLCAIFAVTEARAVTVNGSGEAVCGRGKQQVYWQEDDGMDPMYRGVVVIDYERFKGVLLYQEHLNHSMVLDTISAGTNIPWRGLAKPDGESYGTIRDLPVDTSHFEGGPSVEYNEKTVNVLIIGASFYWPVCALTSSVDKWFEDAEVPEWHRK